MLVAVPVKLAVVAVVELIVIDALVGAAGMVMTVTAAVAATVEPASVFATQRFDYELSLVHDISKSSCRFYVSFRFAS